MITVSLQGGLGNQMFQYAAARALAEKHGTDVSLDLTWFDQIKDANTTPRVYELDAFELDKSVNKVHGGLWQRVQRKLHALQAYQEPHFHYDSAFQELPNNTVLHGYFQSEKYFKKYRKELLNDFTWQTEASSKDKALLAKISRDTQSVSIHVRRGDYVDNKAAHAFHGLTTVEYYHLALKQLKKRVTRPNLYVFSDEPIWCKQHLTFTGPTIYISHNTQGSDDMHLMEACQHNIIANSSFSWWGAWLNENPNKIIIAPKAWFAHKESNTKDVIPSTWLTV